MSFWQSLKAASELGEALPWVVAIFLLVAVVLFAAKPAERRHIRGSVVMFVLSWAGLIIAAWILANGMSPRGGPYRWVQWGGLLLQRFALINIAGVLVFDVLLGTLRLSPPGILRDLLLAMAYIVAGITLASSSGVDLAGVVATSAVITAVIGLSFQDTLGNMMGGMALQLERAIAVGDWIHVDNFEGLVKEIRWRHTSIETRNWDTIIIPNSVLMKSNVTVLGQRSGQPRQHRQWVQFYVDFRYSPTEVLDTVETALHAKPLPNIASDPPPNCIFTDFKDSYGSYAVRYWLTDLALDDPTNSLVRTRIYFALRRAGIPLSIPAQSVFVTEDDPSRRQRKSTEEIERRVSALKHVELFHSLTDEELRGLAPALSVAPFTYGEAITRQGTQAHWLYLIIKGEVEVRISNPDGLTEHVATLRAGDFFGERGMLTGEPRDATVLAQSDVECYRLDKEALSEVLQRRPQIADDLAKVLAGRHAELEAAMQDLNEEAQRHRQQTRHADFLERIRELFTL